MTLKRDAKSGAYKDRIRLPEDVRLDYQALHGPAWEEKFHRPADTPPDKAVAEHAAWAAKVKGRIATLRDSNGSKGVDLTQRQADALAGDWYRWFLDQHNDNPGHISHWSELKQRALELLDLDQDDAVGRIAIEAHVERFLTDRGVTLSKGSAALLLNSVSREFIAAASTLERRAGGDWSADQHMTELAPGQAPHPPHHHVHSEMWLIREGTVELTINGTNNQLGPGSVGFVHSNDEHGIKNVGTTPATYFVVAVGPGAS